MKNMTMSMVLGCCAAALLTDGAAVADSPKQLVAHPANELEWKPFFPGGPDEAFVIGSKEAKKGPTAFFIRFKGGFDSGWHTHESAYTGIVISGTIIETNKGQAPVRLPAGSYYMQPPTVHKTQCAPGADCVTYIYEDGRFSFTPTDENGKPLPPPKAK